MFIEIRRKTFLLHGQSLQWIDDQSDLQNRDNSELFQVCSKGVSPHFLIGAPFIHTYTHHTIVLSSKELGILDGQILPFSSAPSHHRMVKSFPLAKNKAITFHSHLTFEGEKLLNGFKKIKRNFTWEPLISVLVGRCIELAEEKDKLLRLDFDQELLKFSPQDDFSRIFHTTLDRRYSVFTPEKKKDSKEMRISFKAEELVENSEESYGIRNKLFHFTPGRKIGKFIAWKGKKKRNLPRIKIEPNWAMGILLSLLGGWAGLVYYQVEEATKEKLSLQREIQYLKQKTVGLRKIREIQKEFFQLSTLKEISEEVKFNPAAYLKSLDIVLPKSYWIARIEINPTSLSLEILDKENVSPIEFMKKAELQLPLKEIRLIKTERVEFKGKNLNKYFIRGVFNL